MNGECRVVFTGSLFFEPKRGSAETARSSWKAIDLIVRAIEGVKIREVCSDALNISPFRDIQVVFGKGVSDGAERIKFFFCGIEENETQIVHSCRETDSSVFSWKGICFLLTETENSIFADTVNFVIEEDYFNERRFLSGESGTVFQGRKFFII